MNDPKDRNPQQSEKDRDQQQRERPMHEQQQRQNQPNRNPQQSPQDREQQQRECANQQSRLPAAGERSHTAEGDEWYGEALNEDFGAEGAEQKDTQPSHDHAHSQ
jgi:hypothetical protein